MTFAAGALDGVRVVDLTQYILGPYCTQMLGDLGADVIKVEEPGGDRQRTSGRAPKSDTMGPAFISLNRNKRSLALDLKNEPGRRALARLIKGADIFVHNMRPEAVQRLGFGYEAVKAIKPDIVYVEAVGYDPAGPYAGRQAFDDLIQAASGACGLEQLVNPEAEFRPLPSFLADKTCGLFAAIACLAALRHKERTGEGQYVCVPMLETFTGFLMAEHLYGQAYVPPTGKLGYTTAVSPHRRPRRTKDGWLMIQINSRPGAAKFLELGGLPGAYESERFLRHTDSEGRVTEYNLMLDEATATRTTEDWLALCQQHAIPVMRANEPMGIFEDPQLSQTLFETRQIEGEGAYHAMKPGLRFEKTPVSIRRDAPAIGRDTDEVLAELANS